MSSLRLETNGMESTGNRIRHFNLKLFYITDLVKRKQIEIKYCPTDKILADYISKPLTGNKLRVMRRWILKIDNEHLPVVQQECVFKRKYM